MLPEAGNSRKLSNVPKNESVSYYNILYVSNLIFTQEFKNQHEKSRKCFWKPLILENCRMFQKMKLLVVTIFYMYPTYFSLRNSKIGMKNRKNTSGSRSKKNVGGSGFLTNEISFDDFLELLASGNI